MLFPLFPFLHCRCTGVEVRNHSGSRAILTDFFCIVRLWKLTPDIDHLEPERGPSQLAPDLVGSRQGFTALLALQQPLADLLFGWL